MARPTVTVHMNVSIDGKIDGEFFGGARGKVTSKLYSDELFKMATVNANGAITAKKYHARGTLDLARFEEAAAQLTYDDWRGDVQSETWDVVFDRRGTCAWEGNTFEYGGKVSRVVEVVTRRAPLAYLAFLRSMEIPYLVCGDDELDCEMALEKLGDQFGVESIALGGGARINGTFLEAGLVDRISLVVQPYVSGNLERRSSFNTLGRFVDRHFSLVEAHPQEDGGVRLVFENDDEPDHVARLVEDVCDPDPE